MNSNEDQITEEAYAEASNRIAIALAQFGIDFTAVRDRLVDEIITACDGFTLESELQEKSNTLYDKIFQEQLEVYLKACEYFVQMFVEYSKKYNIKVKVITVDEISVNDEESQETIIDSTTKLIARLTEYMTSPRDESDGEESLEHKMNIIISMYLDTSFILGLTTAKSVNYFANKAEGVEIGELVKALETIFPRIF
jgi:hypothetical protein